MFGPPTPAAVRRMRDIKFHEGHQPVVKKSKKPMPGIYMFRSFRHPLQSRVRVFIKVFKMMFTVNPLTGNVIGDFNRNKISLTTPETIKTKGKFKDSFNIYKFPFFLAKTSKVKTSKLW